MFMLILSVFFSFVEKDAGDVWAPPHPQDLNTSYSAEKKSSHFWQSAPVTEWSKEQVFLTGSYYLHSCGGHA